MRLHNYINEAPMKVGDWIAQKRRDATVYAVVLEVLKNGSSKVLMIDDSYGVAKMGSTKGWHPSPQPIKSSDVPSSEMGKLKKKLAKTKYKDMKI